MEIIRVRRQQSNKSARAVHEIEFSHSRKSSGRNDLKFRRFKVYLQWMDFFGSRACFFNHGIDCRKDSKSFPALRCRSGVLELRNLLH